MAKKTVKVLDLVKMIEDQKAIARAAYEKIDQYSDILLKKCGHGHEIVSEIVDEETKTTLYKRVRVLDNAELLKLGKPLYKSTGFKRVEVEIDILKHKPKEKISE
jgi:hypothetical protein